MVLYRKYRPQKIEELDSPEVREKLEKNLSSAYLPHAFLFAGPKGTGKTSAARIVAKILNCEKNNVILNESRKAGEVKNPDRSSKSVGDPSPRSSGVQDDKSLEPCNTCETCKAITEGRFLDVLEIDAASNRGIDEIRDLREKIKLTPVSAKFKVYIIDEVHMLTNEAFNALLKTLEEPPAHAVFILATTEADKLPETIVSRSLKIIFHKATKDEILRSLRRIVKGEKLNDINDEFLTQIVESADGSFRDSTKLLEQVIAEKAFKPEELVKLLGRDHIKSAKFLELMAKKERKTLLTEINKMSENGADFRLFVEQILLNLHRILLAQNGIDTDKAEIALVKEFTPADINALIKLFSRVFIEIRNTSIVHLPLEVAAVEWCGK